MLRLGSLLGLGREGEIRVQANLKHCVLRISCSLFAYWLQERVDTGTVFCPVVVASQGSSLNHSA
jgi:hypothetical protein